MRPRIPIHVMHRMLVLCGILGGSLLQAAGPASEAETTSVDYERDIKPLLRLRCFSCHGALKQKAGLRLDAGSSILSGGEGGAAVLPGQPEQSLLWRRVASTDESERMPPEGAPLSESEVRLLEEWIRQGAIHPKDEESPEAPNQHWSFQPLIRPKVPEVQDTDWVRNEIDHFVLARLEARGWRPNPEAEPRALLRRVSLDLTGLPPGIQEQEAVARHFDPEDVGIWVDRLLMSPAYGERYARHWLDVARYADSNGYERDAAKPEVWRYRDYVIRSLNDDKPFHRFLQEQLAGDELPDATQETLLATGFLRLGPWDDEPADPLTDRYDQLDDIVNTTSQAFLGLTLGCARCHDHKFDPITALDYYRMVAVFQPLERPRRGRKELTRVALSPAGLKALERRDAQLAEAEESILALRLAVLQQALQDRRSQLPEAVRKVLLLPAEHRTQEQLAFLGIHQERIEEEIDSLLSESDRARLKQWEEGMQKLLKDVPDPVSGYFLHEPRPEAPVTHFLRRGNPRAPGDPVEPGVPGILDGEGASFLPASEHTSQRRLSLAQWMAGDGAPIVARVLVNRVWQWHFGEGLVRTPNDFGLVGERPTHPQLLDWLADWFLKEAEGSLKQLHRLILDSRTYRMSRAPRTEMLAADPDNRMLWRRAPQRLEVEAIRDSMLWVSGQLNPTMYGPPIHPFIPEAALLSHTDRTSIWPAFDEASASRRTVYAFVKRSLLVPMLEVLDFCDTTQTSPKRQVTTVPTQALTLFNGDFTRRQARHFAGRLIREAGSRQWDQIQLAWELALGRLPQEEEVLAMLSFLGDSPAQDPGSPPQALVEMCRVLFNLNEFVYPD